MRYFGKLKGHDLGTMKRGDRDSLYLSEGVYHWVYSITLKEGLNQIFPPKELPTPKPTPELLESLHGFLVEMHQNQIEGAYYAFFMDLNDQLLGIRKDQEKQLVLGYFKSLSGQAMTKLVRFFSAKMGESGVETIKNLPRMEVLAGQREALKSNLANSPLLIPYLEGNMGYFENPNESTKNILGSLIEFEIVFKILRNLNNTYCFENPNDKKGEKPLTDLNKDTKPQKVGKETQKITLRKKSMLSDREAKEFLFKTVFSKKKRK